MGAFKRAIPRARTTRPAQASSRVILEAWRRARMSGFARREQLVAVGRSVRRKGLRGSVEEIAARAGSSPSLTGASAAEGHNHASSWTVQALISPFSHSLESSERPHSSGERDPGFARLYRAPNTDGFRVLVRDAPTQIERRVVSSIMGDVATRRSTSSPAIQAFE